MEENDKPEEQEDDKSGWGRVAKGSTYAIRFLLKGGGFFIAPYVQMGLSPEPEQGMSSPSLILLNYGFYCVRIEGQKLDVIADRITAARLETLREGGSRDGTVIERITVLPREEPEQR